MIYSFLSICLSNLVQMAEIDALVSLHEGRITSGHNEAV